MPCRTELFLDDELIEMTASVSRVIHQPTKHRLNPVLRPDQWWEGDCVLPLAQLYDPEEKLFKCWYRTGPLRSPEKIDGHSSYTGYAVSEDGVHWEKPHLGVFELAGRRDHNVVLVSDGLNPKPRYQSQGKKAFIRSVVRHPNPRDESEKYVCMFFEMSVLGAYLGYSADGIHWRREPKPFWRTLVDVAGWGDDALMGLIYDRLKERWVVYRRVNPQESERLVADDGDEGWPAPDRAMRVMGYADSADLKYWENHQIIMIPDADDPADVEFYGLTCHNYADLYVGYLWVYHMAPEAENIDVQLVTSRDGLNFTRCCRREVFIPSGPHNYYDHMIVVGEQAEPIIVNDQIYLLYEACNNKHTRADSERPDTVVTGALCTFTWDRFVSLQTGPPQPCRVVTKPFVIEHPKLFLNAATWGSGAIEVEVLERNWLPIEGYTAAEANTVTGNALNHPVYWTGGRDLGALVGREVRLKFNMADARLHAIHLDTEDRQLKELPPLKVTATGYAELPLNV